MSQNERVTTAKETTKANKPQADNAFAHATPALVQRARMAPGALTPNDVKHLQRTIGNRATAGLLSHALPIQPKLTLGPAGDKYEQEADQVAAQVVRQIDSTPVQRQEDEEELQMKPFSPVQRQEDEEELQMKPLAVDISRLQRTPAEPIRRAFVIQRAQMPPSALSSKDVTHLQRTIGNRATVGLLSRAIPIQTKLTLGPTGDKYEQEADQVAAQVVRQIDNPPVQRQEDEEELQMKAVAGDISRLQRTPAEHIRRAFVSQRHIEEEMLQGKYEHGPEGGEVDPGVTSRIQAARGGGRPLDEGVRSSMESGFGADFSNVRVHTGTQADSLNRSLNARAFTVGNDIFFKGGEYKPGSSGGKKLLAHELTHTVQQGAAGVQRDTVQRAVGFEFETNYKVERENSGLSRVGGAWRPMRKTELITAYPEGIRMEADENSTLGSTIEFVIDPPVADTNPDGLEAILLRLDGVADSIAQGAANVPVRLDTLTNNQQHHDVRVTPQGAGLTANPQVTGGIAFDKIITMLSEIGGGSQNAPQGHQQAASELEGMAPQMPSRAAARGASVLGTAEFKGLVAFLSSYIMFGAKIMNNYPPLNYTKLISNSVMLRTDFGSMFLKLTEEEREEYEQYPERFVDVVMSTISGIPNDSPDIPVLERGVRKGQTPGTNKYNQLLDNAATKLTRREWLTGITKGVDLLSSHHVPALKSELEGLGALGPTTDDVGAAPTAPLGPRDQGQGIVMEFRNMRKNVPWTRWHMLASSIFDYIVDLNQRP